MAPIPIHALEDPARRGWCNLFAPLCHQAAPKASFFDVEYGGPLVSTPLTGSGDYHSGLDESSAISALAIPAGINAGKSADNYASILARRGSGVAEERGKIWVKGTAPGEGKDAEAEGGNESVVLGKRGEAVQAIAWAAAIAGTKYIIKESLKAGGRQLYKAFHRGDAFGLEGTMFEKTPHRPYNGELQAKEEQEIQAKEWEVIQKEEAAVKERRKQADGHVKRGLKEDDGDDEDKEREEDDGFSNIQGVYFADAWDEVRRANMENSRESPEAHFE